MMMIPQPAVRSYVKRRCNFFASLLFLTSDVKMYSNCVSAAYSTVAVACSLYSRPRLWGSSLLPFVTSVPVDANGQMVLPARSKVVLYGSEGWTYSTDMTALSYVRYQASGMYMCTLFFYSCVSCVVAVSVCWILWQWVEVGCGCMLVMSGV